MNNLTKISLSALAILAAVLVVWFALKPSKQAIAPTAFNTPNPAVQNVDAPKDPTATAAPLAPLPKDNKQAIDTEIQGIDQALQATDTSLSKDTKDTSLGL